MSDHTIVVIWVIKTFFCTVLLCILAKVVSEEISGITGTFSLGVQNEAGQRLTVLPRERIGHSKHHLPETQEKTLHMDITRLSILKSD